MNKTLLNLDETDKYVFISAGMTQRKKAHQQNHSYLNYGLLNLATIIFNEGNSVKLYQGENYSPKKLISILQSNNSLALNIPIFLSIPSYFAVKWAIEFMKIIKGINTEYKIIVGGRWVLADKEWALNKFRNANLIIHGEAENIILDIPSFLKEKYTLEYVDNTKTKNTNASVQLNYSLVENFLSFSPSIELSRGCGYGCAFCADKDVALTVNKSPDTLLSEIKNIINLYGCEKINFYFQSSIFTANKEWANNFSNLYKKHNLQIAWRCETRADINLDRETISKLSSSGLKVLDVGLESGSLEQLKRMNKSTKPIKYLEKASSLLKLCYEYNIWVKVNIMFYVGETQETVNETKDFLEKHKRYIKGISAYPMIIYNTDIYAKEFLNEIVLAGGGAINNKIEESGITEINFSKTFSNKMAKEEALLISREYMSQKDYFDLKSFSYFPRKYTYNEFKKDYLNISQKELPFIKE